MVDADYWYQPPFGASDEPRITIEDIVANHCRMFFLLHRFNLKAQGIHGSERANGCQS